MYNRTLPSIHLSATQRLRSSTNWANNGDFSVLSSPSAAADSSSPSSNTAFRKALSSSSSRKQLSASSSKALLLSFEPPPSRKDGRVSSADSGLRSRLLGDQQSASSASSSSSNSVLQRSKSAAIVGSSSLLSASSRHINKPSFRSQQQQQQQLQQQQYAACDFSTSSIFMHRERLRHPIQWDSKQMREKVSPNVALTRSKSVGQQLTAKNMSTSATEKFLPGSEARARRFEETDNRIYGAYINPALTQPNTVRGPAKAVADIRLDKFRSLATMFDMALIEANGRLNAMSGKPIEHEKPTVETARLCFEFLGDLTEHMGRYKEMGQLLKDELYRSAYSPVGFDPDFPNERRPFFAIADKLFSEVSTLSLRVTECEQTIAKNRATLEALSSNAEQIAQIQALRAKVKELSEMNKMQQAKLEVTEKAAADHVSTASKSRMELEQAYAAATAEEEKCCQKEAVIVQTEQAIKNAEELTDLAQSKREACTRLEAENKALRALAFQLAAKIQEREYGGSEDDDEEEENADRDTISNDVKQSDADS